MDYRDSTFAIRWIRLGIVAGVIASVSYPLMVFVHFPRMITVTLGSTFGPALAIASIGFYYFLRLEGRSVSAQLGAVSNMAAGAIVTAMILVQLAIRMPQLDHIEEFGNDESFRAMIHWIWFVVLGLDVAFDVFIGLGTFCFGIRMMNHPRFGKIWGTIGILIAVFGLWGLNFYTFPYPPREAGFTAFDPGPHTALFYLAVTIRMWLSLGSVRQQLDDSKMQGTNS